MEKKGIKSGRPIAMHIITKQTLVLLPVFTKTSVGKARRLNF